MGGNAGAGTSMSIDMKLTPQNPLFSAPVAKPPCAQRVRCCLEGCFHEVLPICCHIFSVPDDSDRLKAGLWAVDWERFRQMKLSDHLKLKKTL